MPTLLSDAPENIRPQAPPRKRWTREQCAPPEKAGLFEQEHLELVDGELISKRGKNCPHMNAAMLLPEWLPETFGKRFVNVEAPIDVSPDDNNWSEPEPDLIVLKPEYSNYKSGNVQPEDLALLIEVSDSASPTISRLNPLFMHAAASRSIECSTCQAGAWLCIVRRFRAGTLRSASMVSKRVFRRSPRHQSIFGPVRLFRSREYLCRCSARS